MNAKQGNLHISKDKSRGYIEFDPYLELSNGRKLHGKHGIMNIPAEVTKSAYEANMLDNIVIKDILKDK